jgi:hypothetical protein
VGGKGTQGGEKGTVKAQGTQDGKRTGKGKATEEGKVKGKGNSKGKGIVIQTTREDDISHAIAVKLKNAMYQADSDMEG